MDILQSSIKQYYQRIYNYNELFKKITSVRFEDSPSDTKRCKIIINDMIFEYQTLGRFDESTNFWEWGWLFENIKNKVYDTRTFFKYATDLYEENSLIKNILLNAKIKIKDELNLFIILGISLTLLEPYFNYKLIYKIKESDTISKYIILRAIE